MARTAKRYLEETKKPGNFLQVYQAGIYGRLSVDNDEKKSESIDTQITLIQDFIAKNNENPDRKYEIDVCGIYTDLGKTGTNFERAGFEEMMQDVREGKINCILVKDFSRFGRNYIETGNYLENILPFMKVRFISVCDHYDSFAPDAKDKELAMNLKNLVNDVYAKDISTKEKASKRIAQKNGEYVGAKAAYGYRSEKVNGRYKLIVDPEPAKIVCRIFEEYAAGETVLNIVEKLFKDGVHRISDYNKYQHVYCQDGETLLQWSPKSVRSILERNNYYGDLVQRKYESRFQRGEKGCDVLDKSQWITVSQTHEPIISRELFDKVQLRLEKEKRNNTVGWDADERAFYNVFYCGDCGRKMSTRKINGRVSYYCGAYQYLDERKCTCKVIAESKVQELVRSELASKFRLSRMRKKDLSAVSRAVYEEEINKIQKEIKDLDIKKGIRAEKMSEGYRELKEEKISVDIYQKMQEERNSWNTFFEERKRTLEERIRKLERQQKEETRFLRSLVDLKGKRPINAALAEALIESMYIYSSKKLEINFRFKGEIRK